MSPLPHILFCSEHNPAVLTQDSHNLPQELVRKESRNESYASFGQWLCSQIVRWGYYEESSGPCGYTSNQGSAPSSTAGCISLGNTTMAAPSMGRAKVSHFHGKSHVSISKIPNSHSNNLLQSWNCSARSDRGLRIFPSWLKFTALLPTVPHCRLPTNELVSKGNWTALQYILRTRSRHPPDQTCCLLRKQVCQHGPSHGQTILVWVKPWVSV